MEQTEETAKEQETSPAQKEEQPSLEEVKEPAEEDKGGSAPGETPKDMPESQEPQEDEEEKNHGTASEGNEDFKQDEELSGKNFVMPKTFEVEIHMDENQVTLGDEVDSSGERGG